METVKVDNQKLQLLNERIAQTIEALNQVRMSAHAIQHTLAVPPQSYAQYGAYASTAFSPVQPFYGVPYAQQAFVPPYAVQPHPIAQTGNPYVTPFTANPYATSLAMSPFVTPFSGQNPYVTPFSAQNPYTSLFTGNPYITPFATTPFTGSPFATTPYTTPFATTPFTGSPFFGGIQQTTAPVASPLGAWSMPYVGNGISQSPWDPSAAMRGSHTWQHPYSATIS